MEKKSERSAQVSSMPTDDSPFQLHLSSHEAVAIATAGRRSVCLVKLGVPSSTAKVIPGLTC